jgi:hypothetical protein
MSISNTDITSGPYTGNGITTTFAYGFKVVSQDQLTVYETDTAGAVTTLTLTTHYTVSGVGNAGGGNVTRVAGALPSGYKWYIRANYALTQPTAFTSQGAFFPALHEAAIDKLTIITQQLLDLNYRSFRLAPSYSGAATSILAPSAGAFIRWADDGLSLINDPDGAVIVEISGDITTVAGIAADVTAVADNEANVNIVAGISANVTTVAGIAADVTAAVANETNINAVVANEVDISAVALINTQVSTVASISTEVLGVYAIRANILTVDANATNINTVAGINAAVTAVAGNATNINTVAGIDADVSAVAVIAADVTAVAANATNINTVAGIAADVTAVAGIAADVTAVAGNATNIGLVVANETNIDLVAANIADINTVANAAADMDIVIANLTDIQNAAANANSAAASAAASAASAASAAEIVGLSTVQAFTSPLTKAIRVALLASASVRTLQVLDDADIDMGTNNFSVVVQKRITTTRPAANEILYHKHNGTLGIIVTLLTTGIVRLTINATTFDSTVALTSASNVEPVIIIPVTRETTAAAGSVTFVVDGVQLGTTLVISARVEEIVNGTFDADITGWTLATSSTGTVTWNAGKMRVGRSGASNARSYQAVAMAAGETLYVSAAMTYVSGAGVNASITIRDGVGVASSTALASNSTDVAQSETLSVSYYSATAQTVYVHCGTLNANGIYDFDTVTSLDSATVDNASNLYLCGTSTTTTEGSYYDGAIYNRALSVTECLNYCLRGPEIADVGGTQTNRTVTNGDFEAWSTSTNPTTWLEGTNVSASIVQNTATPYAGTSSLTFAGNGTSNTSFNNTIYQSSYFSASDVGKRFRFSIAIKRTVGSGDFYFGQGQNEFSTISGASITSSYQVLSVEKVITTVASNAAVLHIAGQAGSTFTVDNLTVTPIGITGHWPAFNAQTNTGQLADRSGNKNHMMLPASGATILGDRRPDVQLTWDNTWAATSELQYFPGVNQACYPTNFYIEGIILTPSATTTAGFTIGNGSDADYYATANGPLTSGVPVFVPLTNRYSDGTNLKLTITPMATTTCTLATTVFGRLLGGF